MNSKFRLFAAAALAAGAVFGAVSAHAQSAPAWPTKPIRYIVPFAPGGPGDVTGRMVAQKLSEMWGQQVVVDNKAGGNTVIGAVEAARAAPDGYTLFQPMNSTLTINQFAMSKMPYDAVRDYTHIGVIAAVPLLVMANDTLPAKNIKELIAYAKANPGKVTVGGGNIGQQLAVERFVRDSGAKVTYVPYKSGADVTKALLSGEIQVGFDGVPAYPAFIKSGRLRALATNSPKRIALLPDVPSLTESGLQHSEAPIWHALVAPAGLAPEIRAKIARDVQAVLAMPDIKERMGSLGLEPSWMNADAFVNLIRTESATYGPIVKDLGIKME